MPFPLMRMPIILQSRLLINRLKPRFRLRTMMTFIALAAVWMAYVPKVRDRWQSLADQAGMQEQLAVCDDHDALVQLRLAQETEDLFNEAKRMTPDQRYRRMISIEQIECYKSEFVDRREHAKKDRISARSRRDSARRLRRRWW